MKNVLIIINDTTALYNFRFELVNELISRGYAVTAMCHIEKHAMELEQAGCRIVPIEISRHGKKPLEDIGLYLHMSRAIKELRPDVVCTYNIKPNVYGGLVCARQGIPYLVNVCGLGTPVETPGLMQTLTCSLYKLGVKKAQCVFFQNEENQEFFLRRKMLSGRYQLLPGSGVNVDRWRCLPYPQGESVDFLFVSRIMKEKGIDQYLQAAEKIKSTHPNTRFHVVGACEEPSYRAHLEELEEKGIIQYHGWQGDMLPFQRMNCCAVHPTYYPEGISNVLLEAAASGRPIITTDRSGCREIVEDGVNGYICRQRDTEDLVLQIEKFLALPWEQRRAMGLAARRKVEIEFDRQIVIRTYLEEIKRPSR